MPTVSDTASDPALSADAAARARLEHGEQHIDAKLCDDCKSTGTRNLVVCIDGTSNQFSTKNTNVVELYSRLLKDKTQLTFYNSGIGTYAKPSWRSWDYRKQVIANALDLAFALRFEKIIISAYAWLVDNYEPGDRIFLFGFSRGAYQVRALAAMIDIVGLLHKGNTDQIPFAYELYAASGDNKKHRAAETPSKAWRDIRPLRDKISHAWKTRRSTGGYESLPTFPWPAEPARKGEAKPVEEGKTLQEQFKKTFSRQRVRVHFVGAWDTVSSVGFIRDKTLPSTTDGMRSVCFFRHALALHEFRVKFLPEYVNGGAGPSSRSTYVAGSAPHTKEVWFTGSHSDIGGGSSTNTNLDKFGPALRWMSWEAASAGLRFEQTPDSWEPISVTESMSNVWRIIECMPIKRLLYPTYHFQANPPTAASFTWRPHFFAHRQIQPWQRIHQSVYEECLEFVAPNPRVMLEADAYLVLPPQEEVLRRGWIFDDERMLSFQQLTSTWDGIGSLNLFYISQYIYDLARRCWARPENTGKILTDLRAMDDAYVKSSFQFEVSEELPNFIDLIETSSATFPFRMCGHTQEVSSVAFLSDTRVISGSRDGTLRIWDINTGESRETTLGTPADDFGKSIRCLAAHAAKGLVAFACDHSTIRLSTFNSDGAIRAEKVLQGESSRGVYAVAFSPDGSLLVSWSWDREISVWDIATGERLGEPGSAHTDEVISVAFSSDGKRIASGGDTVRLWDWLPGEATLKPCGEPLNGHTCTVFSVAFSPDTRVIASGSADKTVRIWDVATRTSKFKLTGHLDNVRSVAFQPSGPLVLSGSLDRTVRTWDARTGAAVRVIGIQRGWVMSVAFSPDGKRIASGSSDRTVRIWDFATDCDEPRDEDPKADEQIESM